ncbi:hypothetical protein [Alteromonas sp. KUL49]|uniref:hypothetical protein n=1 Tax=Alteromonas sp. KUL49 TaxID=2480798 RepID=UPI00102F08E6|nr:hypothetical protein [Alteromonas sp. KUL49]TAP42613.1 hypothetical protein EYS00_03105 [Alteromonas sp. KUL49]GEA10253.1 hypothetical protein KUL49_06280 [Alteromonas sp. KUL49]
MKNIGIIFLSILILVTSACTVTSPVVIPKIQNTESSVSKRTESVFVYLDNELTDEKYEIQQLMTVFQYDLGDYFKNAVHDSLIKRFTNVVQSESSLSSENFDLVVRPELLKFEAPVPPLVTMNTKTEITLKYHVTPRPPSLPFELVATGTYEILDEEDEQLYESLQGKDIYYYDFSSGIGLNIPAYSYEAGKDSFMAIHHALESLNEQLAQALKNN